MPPVGGLSRRAMTAMRTTLRFCRRWCRYPPRTRAAAASVARHLGNRFADGVAEHPGLGGGHRQRRHEDDHVPQGAQDDPAPARPQADEMPASIALRVLLPGRAGANQLDADHQPAAAPFAYAIEIPDPLEPFR